MPKAKPTATVMSVTKPLGKPAEKPAAKSPTKGPAKPAAKVAAKSARMRVAPKATKKPAKRIQSAQPDTPSLAEDLASKIRTQNLSLAAAARAIGVNPVGLKSTLTGKSQPNARTAKRYARWLSGAAVSTPTRQPSAKRGRTPKRILPRVQNLEISSTTLGMTVAALLRAAQQQPSAEDWTFLADKLARRVHDASPAARRLIGTVLTSVDR